LTAEHFHYRAVTYRTTLWAPPAVVPVTRRPRTSIEKRGPFIAWCQTRTENDFTTLLSGIADTGNRCIDTIFFIVYRLLLLLLIFSTQSNRKRRPFRSRSHVITLSRAVLTRRFAASTRASTARLRKLLLSRNAETCRIDKNEKKKIEIVDQIEKIRWFAGMVKPMYFYI